MNKREFKSLVNNPTKAVEFITEAGVAYQRTDATATETAVTATRVAVESGLILGDGKVEGSMSTKAFAAKFGLSSAANVTRWVDLGRLHFDLGLAFGDEFARIARGPVNNPAVRDAIRHDKATLAKVQRVIAKEYDAETGERKTKPTRAARGGKVADKVAEATGVNVDLDNLTSESASGMVRPALATLRKILDALDTEAWAKAETAIQAEVTRQVTLRTKAAAKAAKAA